MSTRFEKARQLVGRLDSLVDVIDTVANKINGAIDAVAEAAHDEISRQEKEENEARESAKQAHPAGKGRTEVPTTEFKTEGGGTDVNTSTITKITVVQNYLRKHGLTSSVWFTAPETIDQKLIDRNYDYVVKVSAEPRGYRRF